MKKIQIFLLFLFSIIGGSIKAQNSNPIQTVVTGIVLDSLTQDTLFFSNITVVGTSLGTATDEHGAFKLIFSQAKNQLKISMLGYKTKAITIENGKIQAIIINLCPDNAMLQDVVVKVERYRNKRNPAVELIQKVIANKSTNRLESHDYYQYQQYEKLNLDLADVPKKVVNSKYLKNLNFFFENADTMTIKGKKLIPAYQKETASDVYFRKSTQTTKNIINGEKHTDWTGAFDDDGVTAYLKKLYISANIYDNEILLFKKPFLSPLSPLSPQIYHFYIIDTVKIEGQRCINLAFFPRIKADLAFEGNLYITNDSTYAIKKVDMHLAKDININFINGLQITQNFDKLPNAGWTLVRDVISLNFAGGTDSSNTFGIFGRKTTLRNKFIFDKAADASIYQNQQISLKTTDADKKTAEFWTEARQEPLQKRELSTYAKIDSLTQTPTYKRYVGLKYFWFTGYWNTNKGVEFGPNGAVYSHNALEGGRVRLGGRTTYDLSHHFRAEGYGAYGFRDKKWKYSTAFTYQLNDNFFNNRPQNAFKIWALNDVEIPGQTLENVSGDNILSSFSKGTFNKMYYKRSFGLSYINESNEGITYHAGIQQRRLTPAGSLTFVRPDLDISATKIQNMTTNEAFFNFRYAPNEEFFQGQTYRKKIVNKYPVFGFHTTYGQGGDNVSSTFNYCNVSADIFKRFYIAPIGHTDVQLELGRTFGKNLPYPVLHAFQANQTLNYEQFAFNQMNYLEFISDKYAFLNVEHAFDGFILNKIPLIKKLKWREYIMFKAAYGGLDDANNPMKNNAIYRFPTNDAGQSLTYNMDKKPYMELGFGIGNIFKVFRVDATRRLNYWDNANVSKWRFQGELIFDF
jgi:hypothetical protein